MAKVITNKTPYEDISRLRQRVLEKRASEDNIVLGSSCENSAEINWGSKLRSLIDEIKNEGGLDALSELARLS